MKIKNIEMVNFLQTNVIQKALPTRLYYALRCNSDALAGFVPAYNEAFEKAKKEGDKAVSDLLNQEIEVNIQTVPQSTLDLLDTSDKYDTLTWQEFNAIAFMIE